MSQKSWYVLRVVAGLYLVYLGISIIRGLLSERPEDMLFKAVIGVIFIVVGALYVIFSAKRAWKINQEVQMDAVEDTEDAEVEETEDGDADSNREIAEDIECSEGDNTEESSLIDVEDDFEDESEESKIEAADEEEK